MKIITQCLFASMQYLLPHHLISRVAGWFANSRSVRWKNFFITSFIRHYKVDMSPACETEPRHYENFNDFFTRALRHEERPIVGGESVVTSPVDGVIYHFGGIHADKLLQAKKRYFSLQDLLFFFPIFRT